MSPAFYASSGASAHSARRAIRVLVVDDEPDTVKTLSKLLELEGYDTHGVHSGREALVALEDFDPTVVILDIAMPGMSGWEVAREIQKLPVQERPMLIAVSGEYMKGADKVLAQITGFSYFVAKPCDPNVLLNLVSAVKPR